ncbi:MAG TPA: hypothetical protein VLX60_04070 [Terriglobales bacterium]|nr:hypothetical protein [Terriglobales bacterium]
MVETILFGALASLGIVHLVAPFALHSSFRFSAHCRPRLLAAQEWPAEVTDRLRTLTLQLGNLGFEFLGCYDLGELGAHTDTMVALFSHPNTNDFASLLLSTASHLQDCHLEFSTEFSSGMRLETNNNDVLPLTPDPTSGLVFRFPEMREPRALYRLHRQLIEKHAAGAWPKPEVKGQEIGRWVGAAEQYGPRHAELGFMKLMNGSEFYRLTWKGAVLMAWKGLWPTSMVRQWLYRQGMRAELRSLEMRGVTALQKA